MGRRSPSLTLSCGDRPRAPRLTIPPSSLPADMTLEAQQIVGDRYQLQRRLGHTAASRQTWLALDQQQDQEPVIVKLLAFNPQMQLDELKLFEREAQVLQDLDHPRIPQYRDYFSIDSQVVWFGLVQTYIPGTSLQERLDQGELFEEEEVRQLGINILHILRYLHEREAPVLHRDIKPSNLILGDDGYVYLVDFGAVQDKAALTGVTFTVVGTCGYAPLEQFWGRAVPASDLYALGATLIHLLTGIPPADLPQRNGCLQLPDSVTVRPFFKSWLEKLVAVAQENRFSGALEALEALERGILPAAQLGIRRIQQPDRSNTRVVRSPDRLQLTILPKVSWAMVSYFFNIGCVGLFVLVLAIISLATLGLTSFLGASLVAFGVGLLTLILVLFVLLEKTEITLEGDRLQISRTSLGLAWDYRTLPLQQILGVFWQKRDSHNGVVLRTEREILNLRQGISELECVWLVQELQDWIDHH